MEESGDQINDEVAVDAALPQLSVTTASESEMSSNDQVVSTSRKQRGINTITFLPNAELSSSLAHDQPLPTLGDTLWAAGWVIKAQNPEFSHSNRNG